MELLDVHTQLQVLGLGSYEAEHRFCYPRRWKFDFAWPQLKIALEIEGGTWGKAPSRHTTGAGFQGDCEKYNEGTLLGWAIYRVTTKQVNNGYMASLLQRVFAARSK